ncbi:Hydrogen cyanide synthase subunit HcnC precursor [Planctomycetes bacterium Pan216]|uniref:Hydrogen cyanide synthase subunit HcnC n=1 Tax=Kolteria novifilia TaxID=2527975 RepID=A0A518BB10_9BACT|nr:Hydrogen cyanide synthase subunit HcnC precursor [Planctomycetes bacterium Pan216]
MPTNTRNYDVVCVGGGVIGLITAYELSRQSLSVAVLDKGRIGTEASWAGAGIISPARRDRATSPFALLRAVSYDRFPSLARELAEETGIDTGFHQTGGIFVGRTPQEKAELDQDRLAWIDQGIDHEAWTREEIESHAPALAPDLSDAFWVPEVSQVRNPRFLRALIHACERRGVTLLEGSAVVDFIRQGERISGVRTTHGETFTCGQAVLTAGAWTEGLARSIGSEVGIRPVQGQIVAVQTDGTVVPAITSLGKRYLVPRRDGLVLIGSTEADVGFDVQPSSAAADGLLNFGVSLYPRLAKGEVVASWAGLRPGSDLGSPIISRDAHWENVWLATGHFRKGIQLAPATGLLLADWMRGEESFVPLGSFDPSADRVQEETGFRS